MYGDPHVRNLNGKKATVPDLCSYTLATDQCNGSEGIYTITLNSETRSYGKNNQFWVSSLDIVVRNTTFTIDKEFKINGTVIPIPQYRTRYNVVMRGVYISFETELFTLQFDGIQNVKFYPFESNVCGLCESCDEIDFDKYRL